ncbi:TPA: hypothetical protein ACGPB2_000254 [Streptococcus suis]
MLDVHTLLTTLASSTNRSYARWKALLSYHPSQMALILEQLNESILDSIYDIRVIRLIERRAKSCRKASNRAYLLEWCKARRAQFENKNDNRLLLALSIFIGIAQFLSLLTLLISLTCLTGTTIELGDEQISFLLSNIWGSFLTLRVLNRLQKRRCSLDYEPVFQKDFNRHLYILGGIIALCMIPSFIGAYLDIFGYHVFSLTSIFRGFAYALAIYLLFQTTKTEFIPSKSRHNVTTIYLILFTLFTYLLSIFDYDYRFLFFIILWNQLSLLFNYKYLGSPEVEEVVKPLRYLNKRVHPLISGTCLLLIHYSILTGFPIQYGFLGLTFFIAFMTFLATYNAKLSLGDNHLKEALRDIPNFYFANQIIFYRLQYKNKLSFKIERFRCVPNYSEQNIQSWNELYLLITSIEHNGIYKTLSSRYFVQKIPLFINHLKKWQISYLVDDLESLLPVLQQGEEIGWSKQNLKKFLLLYQQQLLRVDDAFLQQSTLIQWHLYQEYQSFEDAFKI